MRVSKVLLLCSFAELSFDYDYTGLSSFNDYVDQCIFFNNDLTKDSVLRIEGQMTVPISWTKYSFTDFSTMRNDLLRKARRFKNSWVIMIDDCYCINSSISKKDLVKIDSDLVECQFRCHDYRSICSKIFRPEAFEYILRVHEVLVPTRNISQYYTDSITILDIPDYERSHERVLKDLTWMKGDIITHGHNRRMREHIGIYLADAYYTIGRKEEAVAEYTKVLDLGGPYSQRALQGLKRLSSQSPHTPLAD